MVPLKNFTRLAATEYHYVRQNMNISYYLRRYYVYYGAVYFYRDYESSIYKWQKTNKKKKNFFKRRPVIYWCNLPTAESQIR